MAYETVYLAKRATEVTQEDLERMKAEGRHIAIPRLLLSGAMSAICERCGESVFGDRHSIY